MRFGSLADAAIGWGTTPAERAAPLPCDDLLPGARTVVDRAVTVEADPATTFRWLCQLRVAPYSYDLIDNFGRRSPRELTPGVDQLEPGQRFITIFRLVAFDRDRHITIARGAWIAVTYAIHADRLHMRIRTRDRKPLLPYLDLPMARRQLLNLKELAERDAAP
jgi:hypothetical protein